MSDARKPRIAVLLGDPSGIGPEVGVKLLARDDNRRDAELLLIAEAAARVSGERIAQTTLPLLTIDSLDGLRFEAGLVTHLAHDGGLDGAAPRLGQSTQASGTSAMRSLALAVDAVRRKLVDGIVFAPLNKHSLRLGGLEHEDELRYLQAELGVEGFVCEFNITSGLWTSRVTSHVPLSQVAALITDGAVRDAVLIIDRALQRAGIAAPRIAVSGLNPHAGDGGSIGREEIDVIEPAVRALQRDGIDARGPYSPDTVFIAARRGDYDAVVSMYHDQGQIAMKLMGFERGVTLHGGLPVPVATCASGSAFDIAGRGVANVEGLQSAFDLCLRMARGGSERTS